MSWKPPYIGPVSSMLDVLDYIQKNHPYLKKSERDERALMEDVLNYEPKPFTGKYSGETYNPVSYADSTFYSFLDELNFQDGLRGEYNPNPIYSDDEIAKELRSIWLAGGAPAIAQKNPYHFMEQTGHHSRAYMEPGRSGSRFESEDYQRELDELYIREGDLHHFIAEMSHSIDFNKPPEARKALIDRSIEEYSEYGDLPRYDVEGSIEHHAHKVTEAELLNHLKKRGFEKPDLWRNKNPYWE